MASGPAIRKACMAEAISYKLDNFEGPLDLLLHLIDKDKINIYDIPIVSITEQYLDYVRQMTERDLNVMSDFMVMAATLLDIKARMLLPKEVDPETGEEVDPREELVRRLIEHRKYKLMAGELADMEIDAGRHLFKDPTVPKEVSKYEPPVDLDQLLGDLTLARLQTIFDDVMKRKQDRVDPERSKFGTIKKEKVSIAAKVASILQYAEGHRSFSFRELLNSQSSKTEVVVAFLAILELTKVGKFHIIQDDLNDDITIEVTETGDTELDLTGLEDFES